MKIRVERVRCEYPLIQESNTIPYHFIHGFRVFLSFKLGVRIRADRVQGDVHLTDQEESWLLQVEEITGTPGTRSWIIVSGGEKDLRSSLPDVPMYGLG